MTPSTDGSGVTPATRIQAALALHQRGKLAEAERLYEEVLAAAPDSFDALHLLGMLMQQTRRYEWAVELYRRAIVVNPGIAEVHSNLGIALKDLRRTVEAIDSYDRAIALKPDFAQAYFNRGNGQSYLKRLEESVASYDKAIALQPDYAGAHYNRGTALYELKRYAEGVASIDRAIALKPDIAFAHGERLNAKMKICDWTSWPADIAELETKLERGERASSPFPILALFNARAVQQQTARFWSSSQHPTDSSLPAPVRRPKGERIKLGYLSADLHNQATSSLSAELFERHDRSRFEVVALSFGADTGDEMRKRLEAGFDRFIDVRDRSDREVALLARELEIDIAVDLMGYMQGNRPGIFALRAAPVQVNYLGYPGTTGAEYMDYLIGDPVVIPDGASRRTTPRRSCGCPDSYQPNDTTRRISERVFHPCRARSAGDRVRSTAASTTTTRSHPTCSTSG